MIEEPRMTDLPTEEGSSMQYSSTEEMYLVWKYAIHSLIYMYRYDFQTFKKVLQESLCEYKTLFLKNHV